MSHPCQRSNPLMRGGTDQPGRRLPALDPAHFQVDERSLADFILFARRYARNVRFHGEDAPAGTSWEVFFAQDISVSLATLASLPLQRFLDFKNALRRFLTQGEGLDSATRNAYFALLLQLPLLLLNEIGATAQRLPRDEALIRQLTKWAGRELGSELLLLKSYLLGAEAAPLQGFSDQALQTALLRSDDSLPAELLLVPEQVRQHFTALNWSSLAETIFSAFPDALDSSALAAVLPDPTPFQHSADHHGQVDDALRYNLLTGAIEKLLSSVQVVIGLAARELEASLERSDHAPHYGLWLTFLRLYRHPQVLLNTFTGRHLDFHYRDVLQLRPLPPVPDQVALVLELAKHKQEHLLSAGTRFSAGKDAAGRPREYALLRDTVLNRGRIAALKGLSIVQEGSNSYAFAAEQVDSADGRGAKLDKQAPHWPPFGPAHDHSLARPGCAFADPKLRLSDGEREIRLRLTFVTSLPAQVQQVFGAALSVEDGWLELSDAQLAVSRTSAELRFTITLDSEQPPVLPYDPAVHGFNFATQEPVLRLWLKPESGRFLDWRDARLSAARLTVEVHGSRQFSLANDQGVLDPAKPSQAYGAQPRARSHFILGGRELFSKPLASLSLHPVWQEPLGVDSHFSGDAHPFAARVTVEYLKGGRWRSVPEPLLPLFANAATPESWQQLAAAILLLLSWGLPLDVLHFGQPSYLAQLFRAYAGSGLKLEGLDTLTAWEEGGERYHSGSLGGFVRFRLENSFGHERYPQENTLALLAKASPEASYTPKAGINYADDLPLAPYTPVLAALTLDYESTDDAPLGWFHVHPFGSRAVRGLHPGLLPPLEHAGELYIGLEGLAPPQSVALLFAAVEGSANPLKPPAELLWHYLRGDDWVEIPANRISDSSGGISGSGIISFELPADADTQHGILPAGQHWLRLAVTSDTDALCRLLGIYTQAVSARLSSTHEDDSLLAAPLPAGSVAKLALPDTAVKAVSQVLPSFGGKPGEGPMAYRQRVSERLRHKDRAVSVWDYEHLVLQHFPQVYKVRCLNHTALCRDAGGGTLAENGLKPGAVLVVPIPLLAPGNAADPHRPYNTTRTLQEIAALLRERISPFVHLEVQNPRIEEIQLDFQVAFTDDVLDSGFYLELLNQELKRFLMPWANAGEGQADFGGKWYKSVLIDFIEERPYVDYIQNVRLFHRPDILDPGTHWRQVDREVVRASAARSILVSHAQHQISSLAEVSA